MVETNKKLIHQRIRAASDLYDTAVAIKSHRLKQLHPDWSSEQIKQETLRLIERGCR